MFWWFVERLDADGVVVERAAGAVGKSVPSGELDWFGRSVAACAVAETRGVVRLVRVDPEGVRVVVRRAECGVES